jgi:hypothetical protein
MNIYLFAANGMFVLHMIVIVFFIWGIFANQKQKKKYKKLVIIHRVMLIFLLPVQIICCGCPLTAIEQQFRLLADPSQTEMFINGGFIVTLCKDYLHFEITETIVTLITLLLIMLGSGSLFVWKNPSLLE